MKNHDHYPGVISVRIPYEIKEFTPYFQSFVQGMIDKLWNNRHKTPPRQCDTLRFLMLMHREMVELHEQCIIDRNSPNMLLETYDIANFAFLMGMSFKMEQEDLLKIKAMKEAEELRRRLPIWQRIEINEIREKLSTMIRTLPWTL